MSRDQTFYDRADYTFLQFLGDVSAVKDALYSICSFIIFTLFKAGILLDNQLVNGIFRKHKPERPLQTKRLNLTFTSQVLKEVFDCCYKRSKSQSIRKNGLDRVETQLDVVHLVRKLIYFNVLIKQKTTKSQRAFARKNAKFMLGSDRESSESSGSDFNFDSVQPVNAPETEHVGNFIAAKISLNKSSN